MARPLPTGLFVALCIAACAATASACVLDLPVCESPANGRLSRLASGEVMGTSISIFTELTAGRDKDESVFLVDCRTRKGVVAALVPDDWDGNARALDALVEAATSSRRYTLASIEKRLTTLGFPARQVVLEAGYCGCDLPAMPYIGCGDAP